VHIVTITTNSRNVIEELIAWAFSAYKKDASTSVCKAYLDQIIKGEIVSGDAMVAACGDGMFYRHAKGNEQLIRKDPHTIIGIRRLGTTFEVSVATPRTHRNLLCEAAEIMQRVLNRPRLPVEFDAETMNLQTLIKRLQPEPVSV
jgi:hypothetical protein